MGIAELVQNRLGKFNHDGRPAYDCIGIVICGRCFLLGDCRYKAGIVLPVRIIGAIHRDVHVDIIALFPLCQLIPVQEHTGCSGSVNYMDVLESRSVGRIEHINDGRPQGGEGEATADDHYVFAFQTFPWIPVAHGTANSHDIADFHAMQPGRYQSHFVDGKHDKSLFCGRRCDSDRDFSFSGHGKFGELTGIIVKFFFIL